MLTAATPIGDCYRFAVQFVTDRPDARVYHGTVNDQWNDDPPYSHAWVEMDGRCFDWQTQHSKPDGIPTDQYNEWLQPADTVMYNATDALANAVRSGHFGPWE